MDTLTTALLRIIAEDWPADTSVDHLALSAGLSADERAALLSELSDTTLASLLHI